MLKNLNDLLLWCAAGRRRLLLNDDGFGRKLSDLWRRCSCYLFSNCYGSRAMRDRLLLNRYYLRLLLLLLLLLRGCMDEFLLNYFLNYLRLLLLLRCWLNNLLGNDLRLHLLGWLLLYNYLRLLGLGRLGLNQNLLSLLGCGLLSRLLDDLECLGAALLDDLLYLRM